MDLEMGTKIPLNTAVLLVVFSLLIAGCQTAEKAPQETQKEEIVDTGILSVKSTPSSAQVYVDGEFKGGSPFTVYNIPVGEHIALLKKEGYADVEKRVVIKVGRTEEVEVSLVTLPPSKSAAEEPKSAAEKPAENAPIPPPKPNVVNMSKSFIIYYDFERELFTEVTSGNPDVFSSNYNTYIYFTAMPPAKMLLLNKPLKDVKKEDCIKADDTIANLNPGQTLCIKTTKGKYAAIGGKWKDSPAELEWILFD